PSYGVTTASPAPAPSRSANSAALPPVSPRVAARPSFSLARDSVGEPAVALAHVCMPVLPVVPPRPLRIRTGDPQRRELGVERTRLVHEPVLRAHVDEQRGHRPARGREPPRQSGRIARGPRGDRSPECRSDRPPHPSPAGGERT